MVGVAAVVAAHLPPSPLAAAGTLSAVTAFAVGATTGSGDAAMRALGAGVAVVAVWTAVRLQAETGRRPAAAVVGGAGLVVGVGCAFAPGDASAALVVAGASAVVLATRRWPTALLLVPPVALAVARVAGLGDAAAPARDLAAGVAVAAGALGAAALWARPALRIGAGPWSALLAGLVLVAQDVPDLRAAGVLLIAGGVLASCSLSPAALVALAPGVVAAFDAVGAPSSSLAGVAVVCAGALVATALLVGEPAGSVPRRIDLRAGPGVAFGLLPLWGWSGAAIDHYSEAVLVAVAAGLVAVIVQIAVPAARPPGAGLPVAPVRRTGRLRRRPMADTHGRSNPLAQEASRSEAGVVPATGHERLPPLR